MIFLKLLTVKHDNMICYFHWKPSMEVTRPCLLLVRPSLVIELFHNIVVFKWKVDLNFYNTFIRSHLTSPNFNQ